MMDQSDAGSMGIFPWWTNQTQEVWVYSHGGPIRRRKHGYIPTMDACAFASTPAPGGTRGGFTATEGGFTATG
eukprot:5655193-Pyramimonas_sp.AAC.1